MKAISITISSSENIITQLHRYVYVTVFAKRGLPHTFDLQASTIYNLRSVKAMDLEIVHVRKC